MLFREHLVSKVFKQLLALFVLIGRHCCGRIVTCMMTATRKFYHGTIDGVIWARSLKIWMLM